MFKNIYYNGLQKKIYLWETYNGKTSKLIEDFEYKYYVLDKSKQSTMKDINGNPVIEKRTKDKKHLESLKESRIPLYESDLYEDISFLQHRYGNVELNPDIKDFNIAYMDIEIESGNTFPKPEDAAYPINLITVISSKTGATYTWGNREYTGDSDLIQNYWYIPDEKKMMDSFVSWWRKQKFDIVTGWNVKDFDIQYILNRCDQLGVTKSLSPINQVNHKNIKNKVTGRTNYHCHVAGLSIMDYLQLYKKFTYNIVSLESYSLQTVADFEGFGGKLDLDGHINDAYKRDWNRFVEYNIVDTLLVKKIDDKKKFLSLAALLASQALTPLEKIFSSVAVIEGYILRNLHKNNMVMTNRKRGKADPWHEMKLYKTKDGLQNVMTEKGQKTFPPFYVKGAHVDAHPGMYFNVLSFDVESLYPHMIMQYNISPETKVFNPTPQEIEYHNLIKTPINGVYYKRKEGILPKIVKTIFAERKRFKQEQMIAENAKNKDKKDYCHSQQMIRKILINSMYGVMINEYFHFYDVDNARVVTRGGRTLIRYLAKCINMYFTEHWHTIANRIFPSVQNCEKIEKDVITLIDTDSCYVCLDEVKEKYDPMADFNEFAEKMETQVFDPLFSKVLKLWADKYGVDQIINFKREGVINKQFILAKKKYVTELIKDEDVTYTTPKKKYTGIEIKRMDTPKFCRDSIVKVIDAVFEGQKPSKDKVLKVLKNTRKHFMNQEPNGISFNKSITGYRKYSVDMTGNTLRFKPSTPMHVRASICYNYMVKKFNLPYLIIDDLTKVKYVHVKDKNLLGTNVIGYIGNYPEEFKKYFVIDHKEQFNKSFLEAIQRMYDVLDWGNITFKKNKLEGLLG